jgi:hypothetical protein
MPRIIVSIDGVVVQEVQLTKDRTTLGRRPYNDVVIDNLAVSGEHAVLQMADGQTWIEDLDSTNGTYVNGKPVKRQALRNGDLIDIAKYRIRYVQETVSPAAAVDSGVQGEAAVDTGALPRMPANRAAIRVLSGVAAGRELPLLKPVTTVGKRGVAVAAITRQPGGGYAIVVVEGPVPPTVNGRPVGDTAVALHAGDVIEIGDARLRFDER